MDGVLLFYPQESSIKPSIEQPRTFSLQQLCQNEEPEVAAKSIRLRFHHAVVEETSRSMASMSIYYQRSPNIFMKYHEILLWWNLMKSHQTYHEIWSSKVMTLPILHLGWPSCAQHLDFGSSLGSELEALTPDLLHACSFRLGTFAASPLPSATIGYHRTSKFML